MNDDQLLQRLAEAAREEEQEERGRLGPRWDELAAGRLSKDDEAALRSEAEGSMEAREALTAFSPLGAEFRARVTRDVRELLDAPVPERTGSAEAPDARVARRPARRRLFRARPLRWAAAAAFAAAVLLVVVWPEGERSSLPGYQVQLGGEVRTERSPGVGEVGERWDEPALFARGNRFEVVLRPDRAVAGRLEVRTYRQEGGSLLPWPLPVDGPHDGVVRIAGTVGREIDLPAGETRLVVVLGHRGALPTAEEVLARLGDRGRVQTRDWLAWRQTLGMPPAEEPE